MGDSPLGKPVPVEFTDTFILDNRNATIRKCRTISRSNLKLPVYPTPKDDVILIHALLRRLPTNRTFLGQACSLPPMNGRPGILSWWAYTQEGHLLIPYQFYEYDTDYLNLWDNILSLSTINGETPKWWKERKEMAMRITYEMHLKRYEQTKEYLELDLFRRATHYPFPRGKICSSILVLGKEPDKHDNQIVVCGDGVRKNLTNLCRNLDLDLRHVFIYGSSGSGKERYSELVHHGTGRKGKLKKVDMTSSKEEVRQRLFGRVVQGVEARGFFDEAAEGSIIFDEVDKLCQKSDSNERDLSYLLRPLDPGEYYPFGAAEPKKIDHVTFVFVGTKSPLDLQKIGSEKMSKDGRFVGPIMPPDFFTRISDPRVELVHPLPSPHDEKYLSQAKGAIDFSKDFEMALNYLIRYLYWMAVQEKACFETGIDEKAGSDRLQRILAHEFEDKDLRVEERRFKLLMAKWLGPISSYDVDGFSIIRNLEFELDSRKKLRSLGEKRPSVREIKNCLEKFVREIWHSEVDLQTCCFSWVQRELTALSIALRNQSQVLNNIKYLWDDPEHAAELTKELVDSLPCSLEVLKRKIPDSFTKVRKRKEDTGWHWKSLLIPDEIAGQDTLRVYSCLGKALERRLNRNLELGIRYKKTNPLCYCTLQQEFGLRECGASSVPW